MKTINTNGSACILVADTQEPNFSHYVFEAYIMQTKLELAGSGSICQDNTCIRHDYNINPIKAGDTIYFDYVVNNQIITIDFNDTYINYNMLKTSDNNYRNFGLYTITQYDVTGTSGGRLFDYNNMRFIDINSNNSLTVSEVNTYLNPVVHNSTFISSLLVPNTNVYATFYKIQAVDLAGNISEPTYTLVSY